MSAATSETASVHKFVLTDPVENNNKFWECSLQTGGVLVRWGRVGTKGQEKLFVGEDEAAMQKRIRERLRKKYTPLALAAASAGVGISALSREDLTKSAVTDIAKGDALLEALVERLAKSNRHQIVSATGGGITFNTEGYAQTALGLVERKSLASARKLLSELRLYVEAGNFETAAGALKLVAAYLTLIPQKVGARKGWHIPLFGTAEALASQGALLDSLEQSFGAAEQAHAEHLKAAKAERGAGPAERIFEVRLSLVTDDEVVKRIKKKFAATLKSYHSSSHLKVKHVYALEIPSMVQAFENDGKKVGGLEEMWHGTRTPNVLSILKGGLVVPKASAGHTTGRMFGDGVYFSDQSTKSLNYSQGFWDTMGKPYERNCFMFVADVAMGRAFVPENHARPKRAPEGFDSVFAKGGVSGVTNNEMIVYRTSQCNLKYLVEFDS